MTTLLCSLAFWQHKLAPLRQTCTSVLTPVIQDDIECFQWQMLVLLPRFMHDTVHWFNRLDGQRCLCALGYVNHLCFVYCKLRGIPRNPRAAEFQPAGMLSTLSMTDVVNCIYLPKVERIMAIL